MAPVKKICLINGPMGVGKTTVGKHIADTNPGTAFIDGDWCLDIHPFVGNRETKAMAVDNLLHLTSNYLSCSECNMIVIVWLMDDQWVLDSLLSGLSSLEADVRSVTLTCTASELERRWTSDTSCEWRTPDWLSVSLKSLPAFSVRPGALDTTGLSVSEVAALILG